MQAATTAASAPARAGARQVAQAAARAKVQLLIRLLHGGLAALDMAMLLAIRQQARRAELHYLVPRNDVASEEGDEGEHFEPLVGKLAAQLGAAAEPGAARAARVHARCGACPAARATLGRRRRR